MRVKCERILLFRRRLRHRKPPRDGRDGSRVRFSDGKEIMSRIHEALKRAERERAAGGTAQENERQAEYAFDRSAIETEPQASSILHPDDLSQLHSARTETETVHDLIRFDELWAKCSQARWKPDPTSIVFENADSFYPGTEQFRTLRSRLYRMRETQP